MTCTGQGRGCLGFRAGAACRYHHKPRPLIPAGVSAWEGNRSVTVTWKPVAGATSYNNLLTGLPRRYPRRAARSLCNLSGSRLYRPFARKQNTLLFRGYSREREAARAGKSPWGDGRSVGQTTRTRARPYPAGPLRWATPPIRRLLTCPCTSFMSMISLSISTRRCMPFGKRSMTGPSANGYGFDNNGMNGSSGRGNNLPVTMVSWYDTVKWLNARSRKRE